MDLNARVDVNCGRKDGQTDGQTENQTPISHLAKAGATNNHYFSYVFVVPACGERDIVVTTSVRGMCVRACIMPACFLPSGYVQVIISTFMHKFQNSLAQFSS